jgi:hypothetical protein
MANMQALGIMLSRKDTVYIAEIQASIAVDDYLGNAS